jgi:hypothetical protein
MELKVLLAKLGEFEGSVKALATGQSIVYYKLGAVYQVYDKNVVIHYKDEVYVIDDWTEQDRTIKNCIYQFLDIQGGAKLLKNKIKKGEIKTFKANKGDTDE